MILNVSCVHHDLIHSRTGYTFLLKNILRCFYFKALSAVLTHCYDRLHFAATQLFLPQRYLQTLYVTSGIPSASPTPVRRGEIFRAVMKQKIIGLGEKNAFPLFAGQLRNSLAMLHSEDGIPPRHSTVPVAGRLWPPRQPYRPHGRFPISAFVFGKKYDIIIPKKAPLFVPKDKIF